MPPPPQPDIAVQDGAVQGDCKICFDGETWSLPCVHMVMCPPCSDQIMLENQQCPLCRANIASTLRVWFG